MGRYTEGGIGRDLMAGALAGAAAVWVVNKLDWSLYRTGATESIRKTGGAPPSGMDPAHALAKKAADAVGVDVGNPKDNPAGHTMQYVIAMGLGALYGALRGMTPAVTIARGGLYGLTAFIVKNELGNTVMGTGSSPLDYPIQDHARGAAAHALFGVVTDLGARLLAPWRDEVIIEQGPPLSERIEHGRQYLEQGRDYLLEHGRPYLDQGREYLEDGRRYASKFVEEARSRMPEVDAADLARRGQRQARRFAEDVRSRVEDVDAAGLARAGRRQAGRFAEDVRSRLPDIDPAELARAGARRSRRLARNLSAEMPDVDARGFARAGQRHASRFAKEAREYIPEVPTSAISRAFNWLFG